MQRREILKQLTAGVTVVGSFGLAGCSGSGDGNGGANDTETDENDADQNDTGQTTVETTRQVDDAGSVGTNEVDELEIVDWERQESNNGFQVEVTVRNTGDQTTDIFEYEYSLLRYDSSGTDITGDNSGHVGGETEAPPGEAASINVYQSVDGSPSDVATYEIILKCDETFGGGVYCE